MGVKLGLSYDRRREREMYTEELHKLYSSQNIIRAIKIKENDTGGACSTHGKNGV
jgi:hypothetical protein